MAILNSPLACSLCGVESTVGEIGDHLAQVHIGPGDSDWHCSNGCLYRTGSKAEMASHCLITRHPAAKLTRPLAFAFPQLLAEVQNQFCPVVKASQSQETHETRSIAAKVYFHSSEHAQTEEQDSERPVEGRTESDSNVVVQELPPSTSNVESEEDDLPELESPRSPEQSDDESVLRPRFHCDYCEIPMPDRASLAVHIRVHTEERPLQHCPYSTGAKRNLKKHQITHTKNKSRLTSGAAVQPLETGAALDASNKHDETEYKHHSIAEKIEMEYVKDRLITVADTSSAATVLTEETDASYSGEGESPRSPVQSDNESSDKSLTCRICSHKLCNKSNLTRHVKMQHEEHPCPVCNTSFKQKALKEHLKCHTSNLFHCDFCPYAAVNRHLLGQHFAVHSSVRPYRCLVCPFAASKKSDFRQHERKHTGEFSTPHPCPNCPRRFRQRNMLEIHLETNHEPMPETLLECPHCPWTTQRRYNLRRHVDRYHKTRMNPLPCTECGKLFFDRYSREQHMKSHEDDSLTCERCGHVAANKRARSLHSVLQCFALNLRD